MIHELSLEKTFLLATLIEGVVYGFLCFIFGATMYVYFSPTYSRTGSKRDRHTTWMTVISGVMFFIASFHISMNIFRILRGYADFRLAPGGPVGYLGTLRKWDHILKDTLFATQENLGSAAAIYRCWVLWGFNYKVVAFPMALLLINIAAGYVVCATFASVDPAATVFIPRLGEWIKTFYSIVVSLNIIMTGLMGYRIWSTYKRSSGYYVSDSKLLSILRILLESAALQLVVETILLALYCADNDAQYIFLESVTSIVAITFNSITLRIKLKSAAEAQSSSSTTSNPTQTIGRIPMKRIRVNIDQEVEGDIEAFQNKNSGNQWS